MLTKADFFDSVADRGMWAHFPPEQTRKLERMLERLDLKPGMTVVEPGCGTGRLTARLLERVSPGGRVLANDISSRMITLGKARELGAVASFHLGPVESMPLPADGVDRVVCFQCFPHFDDKPGVLRRFHEALHAGGLLVISHFAGREKINALHRAEPEPICLDLIPDREEMEALLADAGLAVEAFEDGEDEYFLLARK